MKSSPWCYAVPCGGQTHTQPDVKLISTTLLELQMLCGQTADGRRPARPIVPTRKIPSQTWTPTTSTHFPIWVCGPYTKWNMYVSEVGWGESVRTSTRKSIRVVCATGCKVRMHFGCRPPDFPSCFSRWEFFLFPLWDQVFPSSVVTSSESQWV